MGVWVIGGYCRYRWAAYAERRLCAPFYFSVIKSQSGHIFINVRPLTSARMPERFIREQYSQRIHSTLLEWVSSDSFIEAGCQFVIVRIGFYCFILLLNTNLPKNIKDIAQNVAKQNTFKNELY